MKKYLQLQQPHIRAKIVGLILVVIGTVFLFNPNPLNQKIAFTSILIGIFMIFMITERSIPKKISDAQIAGNIETVRNITRELNLTGNAIFLPKSDILTEERIFIPLHNSKIKRPDVDDESVFSTGAGGDSLGISIPPSGLKLLDEVEKNIIFENTEIDNVEEKLQVFIGLNLLKSIALKKRGNIWILELEKPIFCIHDEKLCRQFPCPTCSAALTAVTRAAKQKISITNTTNEKEKITFHLKIGE